MIDKLLSKLKLFIYRSSFLKPFSTVEEIISKPLVRPIISSAKGTNKAKNPFFVILTIDSEAGYVAEDEQRLWQVNHPNLFQGFYFGIRNWLNLLNSNNIRATFLMSTQCFSARNKENSLIKQQINRLLESNHELGCHLHPRSDYSLEKILEEKLKSNSSKFYSSQKIDIILQATRRLFKENLDQEINRQIKSFRWGNFGLFPQAIKPLEKNGFLIDSSVCPKLIKHQNDDMFCDWSKIKDPFPFIFKKSSILEIPVTTFTFLSQVFTVNPIYHNWFNQIFTDYWLLNNNLKRPFFFVIHSHSSEATYKNGNPTKIIFTMKNIVEKIKKMDNVSFITLKEAYEIYHSMQPCLKK